MTRTTISQIDLIQKTQEVVDRVQHGEVAVPPADHSISSVQFSSNTVHLERLSAKLSSQAKGGERWHGLLPDCPRARGLQTG